MYATKSYRYLTHLDTALKHSFDVAAAAVGIILLSPLLIGIGVLIKAHDGGPLFYRATRVGKGGQRFRLYKFRTMVVDADLWGPAVTTRGDSRITPIGRWLRRTKLDELPQLLNVLLGDMSLVGPRPEDPRYVALYNLEQQQILSVRPGITSAASLAYRHEELMLSGPDWEDMYVDNLMPAKLKIDLEYLSKRTLWTDVVLILRTIAAMFR
jgi:lipopolysaccharide/colanic/teichoic acid biosynthesis glycosyltransferase